ncbi:AAA family ATPase [Actinomadura viridis]|uniref:AAA family ATPase n=1 Tax=Actinomadura viridis TaxID=58110 RepID=UPI0018C90F82|nr:AAA family ATPase [Actinomadura viridis]
MSRRVVLVCGPPAAGKSTWVAEHAASGDRVVDLDAICRRLGSPDPHNHPEHIRGRARRVRAAEETLVSRMQTGTAWVIRTMPEPERRTRHAAALGATEVVVLATPLDEAKSRAADAGRPAWTGPVIDRWWDRYRPSTSRLERELSLSQPLEG